METPQPPVGGGAWQQPGAAPGQPPYHPAPHPQLPPAPQPAGGLATASFVTALVGLFPLALTLGLVALGRLAGVGAGAARAGRAKGLAIAGVALAGAQIVALAVIIPVAVINAEDEDEGGGVSAVEDDRPGRGTDRDDPGGRPGDGASGGSGERGDAGDPRGPGPSQQPPDEGDSEDIGVYEIEVGDCFDSGTGLEEFEEDESTAESTVTRVGCDAPHEAEAFGTAQVTGHEEFPGDEALTELAFDECGQLLQPYVWDTWTLDDNVTYFFYYPQQAGWAFGDREILCFFGNQDGSPLDGSLRADPGELDEDQRRYLEATTPLEITIWTGPLPEAGLSRHREWAGEMSRTITQEAGTLASESWSSDVAGLIEDLVAAREESAGHWDQAAAAPDRTAYDTHYAEGYASLGVETEIAIRQKLGLATAG